MKGEGNQQDYGMRVYDGRLGKFLSVDPLTKGYPWYTPYQFAGNTPIQAIDLDGEEELHYTLTKNEDGSASLKLTNIIFVQKKDWFYKALGVFNTREEEPRIPERAVINYGDKKYYIGFSGSKGRGNEGEMKFFKSIRRNANEVLYAVDNIFLGEEQSKSVEAFSMAVNTQNNTAMYGPLTQKAWVSRLNESNSKCFVAGTQISINGGLKNIENVLVGDSVWSFNEETHERAIKVVTSRSQRVTDKLVRLNIGREVLWTSPEHPFWINSRWVTAEKIRIGDSATLFLNKKEIVSDKIIIDSVAVVYNFTVADFHTYYVSRLSILVHNDCGQGWISKKLYNRLGKDNPEVRKVFEDLLGKGNARAQGQSGIKRLSGDGKKINGVYYQYELKTPPHSKYGNHRLYGNLEQWENPNKSGVIEERVIFREYAPDH